MIIAIMGPGGGWKMEHILAQFQGHIVAVTLHDGRILWGVLLVGGMYNRLWDLDLDEVFEFGADEVERVK